MRFAILAIALIAGIALVAFAFSHVQWAGFMQPQFFELYVSSFNTDSFTVSASAGATCSLCGDAVLLEQGKTELPYCFIGKTELACPGARLEFEMPFEQSFAYFDAESLSATYEEGFLRTELRGDGEGVLSLQYVIDGRIVREPAYSLSQDFVARESFRLPAGDHDIEVRLNGRAVASAHSSSRGEYAFFSLAMLVVSVAFSLAWYKGAHREFAAVLIAAAALALQFHVSSFGVPAWVPVVAMVLAWIPVSRSR